MTIENIQSGDILAVRGKSFPSPTIVYFMKKYAKKHNITYDFVGSHLATLFWDKNTDKLMVAESVDNGFHFREFEKHYDFSKDDLKVLSPKVPYTEEEVKTIYRYAMHLQTVNIGYQYWNFLQWIAEIELNLNTFGKGNNKFTFCYESTYKIAQQVRPLDFPKKSEKDLISFFDVYLNSALQVIN